MGLAVICLVTSICFSRRRLCRDVYEGDDMGHLISLSKTNAESIVFLMFLFDKGDLFIFWQEITIMFSPFSAGIEPARLVSAAWMQMGTTSP